MGEAAEIVLLKKHAAILEHETGGGWFWGWVVGGVSAGQMFLWRQSAMASDRVAVAVEVHDGAILFKSSRNSVTSEIRY